VSLYWRLTADAAAIHRRGDMSGPRQTALLALAEGGPHTVARLARSRAQSRQRIQPLINALIGDGLVEAVPNPMHKRSPVLVLTRRGEDQIRRIKEREEGLLSRLRPRGSAARITLAIDVLRDIRETLERQLPALLQDTAQDRRRRRRSAPSRRRRSPRNQNA
jgi:DNA-binding MarR family transcriptional regulator